MLAFWKILISLGFWKILCTYPMGDPKCFARNNFLGNLICNQSATGNFIRNNFQQKSSRNRASLYFFWNVAILVVNVKVFLCNDLRLKLREICFLKWFR